MSPIEHDPAFLAELARAFELGCGRPIAGADRGVRAILPAIAARAREEALREAANRADWQANVTRLSHLMMSPSCRADELRSFAITLRKAISAPPVAEPARPEPIGSEGPALHDRIHPTSGRLLHAAPILPARAEPDEAVGLTLEEHHMLLPFVGEDESTSELAATVERIIAQRLAARRSR